MTGTRAFRSGILLLPLLFAGSAHAFVVEHATRSLWEEAAMVFEVEDFESMPAGSATCPVYVDDTCGVEARLPAGEFDIVLPVGSHVAGYDGFFDGGAVNGSREFVGDLHTGVLVAGHYQFTIEFSSEVTSFAVDLARITDECDSGNPFACPSGFGPVAFPVTIEIDGQSFPLAYGAEFFGATSETPFSEVLVSATSPLQGYLVAPALDDVSFTVVPETSTALLLTIGLFGLAARYRV